MIKLCDIEYTIGERTLFTDVNANLNVHDRVGLVGANGSGKTTLLRLIKGEIVPSRGSLERRKDIKIGYLPQEEIVLAGNKLLEEVLRDYNALLNELAQLRVEISAQPQSKELLHRLDHTEENFHAIGGYQYEAEACKVLVGLGFTEDEYGKPVSEFSSGWQMRIVLARMLLRKPDLLLLDEPTNHLDIESIEWLEDYLRTFKGCMVIVSHDRYFVDNILQRTRGNAGIWEIDFSAFRTYHTNYTGYLHQSAARKERLMHRADVQEKRIREIKDFIARNKANKSKARIVKSREKYLARMEQIQVEQERRKIRLSFPVAEIHSRRLVELHKVAKSYNGKCVFRDIDLVIENGNKIALIGKNGAGKSTLSRIICGLENPSSGVRKASERLQIGMFSHELVRKLEPASTVLEQASVGTEPDVNQKIRNFLGLFLFSGDDVLKSVRVLSGGEKARLVILKAMLKASNLLVLDEPTYHLDRESTDAVKNAVQLYGGTVVMVTHDRDLIESYANRIIELKNGKVHDYPGDFTYYLGKRNGVGETGKIDRIVPKKESRLEKIKRAIEEKEERRKRLRVSFMHQARTSTSKKAKKTFDEYQRLTQEIEELESQLKREEDHVHNK
jgi:ATP-binding cassette subfamily F protein 3